MNFRLPDMGKHGTHFTPHLFGVSRLVDQNEIRLVQHHKTAGFCADGGTSLAT